ncbi:epoxide hydrolase family protein [Flavihumibacter solisilvae]|uniref:epoxide hydrolase family protein n=1 Tax=Flavihumibacter solisilvae TaxID=1349421 RepID=UPI00068AEAAD|nr:epoxide hydrolase family protein [Flavihumibacter solisilvae]
MKKSISSLAKVLPIVTVMFAGLQAGAQVAKSSDEAIHPFKIHIPESQIQDLKQRIRSTRWPEQETVTDQSQGVQLATMKTLARYWEKDYNWRKVEAKLNALPQFTTKIDGVNIHFIHVRSKVPNALPVIITHGWPGSILELIDMIGPLTDPVAYGGKPEDAFDVVIPSIPGYGFSGKPTTPDWNSYHIAKAWDTLMNRLGYTSYVSQGGDWGARVSESLARIAPKGLIGIHTNLFLTLPPEVVKAAGAGEAAPAGLSEDEKFAYEQWKKRTRGYFIEQATRPQTIGFSLAETPIGLAAWLLDHDPHSYEQMAAAFNGHPFGSLTKDAILDNITLYWLTNSGASAGRLYWNEARIVAQGEISVPAAFTVFPGEVYKAPRSWVERVYTNLVYFNEVDKGGHFASWEQPQLFVKEMRAAFRPMRTTNKQALGSSIR